MGELGRRARVLALSATTALAAQQAALAGAWTQPRGGWQLITSFDEAHAAKGFDGSGRADAPIRFDKLYLKSLAEYGWSDKLTLFLAPEYIIADSTWSDKPTLLARDMGIEAGARIRLTQAFGIVSLQGSFRFAGPFDLSNSRSRKSARIAELRLLYGTDFKLFGRDGFADLEVAERAITHPRPNETVLDTTAGLWLGAKTLVMLQGFNTVSGGDAEPPYSYFRTDKLELSVVRCWSGRWWFQAGIFVSPDGQNSLVEQGVTTALWLRT